MDVPEPHGSTAELDIMGVMDHIPHRYPFLLIDRLVDIVPSQSATGVKNVTINEPFFQGHFPSRPIMPGVLVVEAMAQTAACLVVYSMGLKNKNRLVYFMSIENARFRKPVVPGDQLRIDVVRERHRANVWRFRGEAKVDGAVVAEATYTAMIANE